MGSGKVSKSQSQPSATSSTGAQPPESTRPPRAADATSPGVRTEPAAAGDLQDHTFDVAAGDEASREIHEALLREAQPADMEPDPIVRGLLLQLGLPPFTPHGDAVEAIDRNCDREWRQECKEISELADTLIETRADLMGQGQIEGLRRCLRWVAFNFWEATAFDGTDGQHGFHSRVQGLIEKLKDVCELPGIAGKFNYVPDLIQVDSQSHYKEWDRLIECVATRSSHGGDSVGGTHAEVPTAAVGIAESAEAVADATPASTQGIDENTLCAMFGVPLAPTRTADGAPDEARPEVDAKHRAKLEAFDRDAEALSKIKPDELGVGDARKLRDLLKTARELWITARAHHAPGAYATFLDRVRGLTEVLRAVCALDHVAQAVPFSTDLLKPDDDKVHEDKWNRLTAAVGETTAEFVSIRTAAARLECDSAALGRWIKDHMDNADYRLKRVRMVKRQPARASASQAQNESQGDVSFHVVEVNFTALAKLKGKRAPRKPRRSEPEMVDERKAALRKEKDAEHSARAQPPGRDDAEDDDD